MIEELPKNTRTLVVSYLGVRRAVGGIGLVLPVLLGPVGRLAFGIGIQNNMSSYYHTGLRDVFVGGMSAIGVFLFCYRGHSRIENWTANLGGLSAVGLALFPLDPGSDPLRQESFSGYVHSFCGGLFFVSLSCYSLFFFPAPGNNGGEEAPNEPQRVIIYRASGVVILLSLLVMGSYLFLFPAGWKAAADGYHFLFWMEWVAVWAFASAWLTKGRAIPAEIAVELLSLPARLRRARYEQRAGRGPTTPAPGSAESGRKPVPGDVARP